MAGPLITTKPTAVGASFGYAFLDMAGDGKQYAPIHASINTAAQLINPATEDTLQLLKGLLQGTLQVTWGGSQQQVQISSVPLPPNAATDTTAQNVLAAVDQLHADIVANPLPSGAATSALQSTTNTTLASVLAAISAGTLPSGAATDNSLQSILNAIKATLTVGLPIGAATDTSVQAIATALGKGQKAAAQSLPVVLSIDGPFSTYATQFGSQADAAATSDAGAFSFLALFKRAVSYLSNLPTLAGAVISGILQTAVRSNAPRVSATGSLGSTGAVLPLLVDGMSTGVAQVSGTWVGVITIAGSIDGGITYFPINVTPFGAPGGPAVTSITANGQWEFAAAGYTHVALVMSVYTSGSANVLLAAANGAKIIRVKAPATDPLPVLDANNAAFGSAPALPASGAAPGRSVGVVCTTAGNIVLTLSGGGTITLPVYVGWQTFPFAATGYSFSGGGAGSVFNLN